MPANVEIKARVADLPGLMTRAAALCGKPAEIIRQEDIFFHTPQGRLKLRILNSGRAQLIYYRRSDSAGPKRSDYLIHEVDEPEGLQALLEQALGVRGIVRKTRHLLMVGQTRVHLDDVEGLGAFVELEVVLRPDQSDAEGQAIAEDLMARLGIDAGDLVHGAYMDLIEQAV